MNKFYMNVKHKLGDTIVKTPTCYFKNRVFYAEVTSKRTVTYIKEPAEFILTDNLLYIYIVLV